MMIRFITRLCFFFPFFLDVFFFPRRFLFTAQNSSGKISDGHLFAHIGSSRRFCKAFFEPFPFRFFAPLLCSSRDGKDPRRFAKFGDDHVMEGRRFLYCFSFFYVDFPNSLLDGGRSRSGFRHKIPDTVLHTTSVPPFFAGSSCFSFFWRSIEGLSGNSCAFSFSLAPPLPRYLDRRLAFTCGDFLAGVPLVAVWTDHRPSFVGLFFPHQIYATTRGCAPGFAQGWKSFPFSGTFGARSGPVLTTPGPQIAKQVALLSPRSEVL